MYHSEIIKLGKEIEVVEGFEVISTFVFTDVFANKLSIKSKEHYDAAQIGLKPEIGFAVRVEDYDGQVVVEWNDVRYYVFRTFDNLKDSTVELYLTKNLGDANV